MQKVEIIGNFEVLILKTVAHGSLIAALLRICRTATSWQHFSAKLLTILKESEARRGKINQN
jgi:hypothetical protein